MSANQTRPNFQPNRRDILLAGGSLLAVSTLAPVSPARANAAGPKPNMLIIMADDIGYGNIGAYHRTPVSRTPNIDRIAQEGAIFTDLYAQPSRTAGFAAFVTGQSPFRTGLLKAGAGLSKTDPTLAELLEAQGYATGRFGDSAAKDFIERQHHAGRPFLCLVHPARMHVEGMTGLLLDQLDGLGIAGNTIVLFTSAKGAGTFSWPDANNLCSEDNYRAPALMRWPGVIEPGSEINEIVSHEDWVPTLMAAAGEPDIGEKLLTGYEAAGKLFKAHLDGYDQRDLLSGIGPGKREEFFYWTGDGGLAALRYGRWKVPFMEAEGPAAWQAPLVTLRLPKIAGLRADPFEIENPVAGRIERTYLLVTAQTCVDRHLQTYVEFPPRQKPGNFSLGDLLAKLQEIGSR